MQEFQTKRSSSRLGRHGALVATLAVLLLGTAGFAVAGGVEMVKGWFITVEVNGEIVDVDVADVTVETDGDMATLTIDIEDCDIETDGEATVTITAVAGDVPCDAQPNESAPVKVETITVRASDEMSEDEE